MEEKRYLKWYNKVGYGSGDFAGNVVYAFLSSFVMLYLTNTVGLNPGIIGTLIMVSKLFDGISDMYSIYVVKCSIFYCKQYSICIISYFLYKKQQGTCRDGIMAIYLCIFD